MEDAVRRGRAGVVTVLAMVAVSAALSSCAPVPAPATTPEQAISADMPRIEWGLVMHGGAGGRTPPAWTPAQRATREASMAAALRAGYTILAAGGSALDAVEAAVVLLEDDSTFNAGRGAVFNAAGENELDASIMDGPTLNAGAVAGVRRVKNPIRLARAVMERSGHVMMVAGGAEEFARQVGIELVDPRYFFTQAAWVSLERERAAEQRRRDSLAAAQPPGAQTGNGGSYYGTVGAVALDRQGRLAAATSTGGRTNKRPGRVGDVPVIGAGNYANPRCAISATGHGEWFIRYTVARDVCVGVEHRGQSLGGAADSILFRVLDPLRVDGGLIGLDSAGNVMMAFNTAVMPRGYVGPDGTPRIQLTR
jgi:L-asparaginase / beta-aspartyl-peptidase